MTPDYPRFVKEFLGDAEYNKYFSLSGGTTTCTATLLEFIHYNVIFYDPQIVSDVAYRSCKERHVYSLLRRITSGFEGSPTISL